MPRQQTEPDRLAIDGGRPVREETLPYGHQTVTDEDIEAVTEVLRSFYLTTGPRVPEFEAAVAERVGTAHAVAFSSGTAALHGAAHAAGIGPGDEAVTTPLTFCATSNCVLYLGGSPVFADVEPDTLNLDPEVAAEAINDRTRAIFPVDYAGHPADMDAFRELADDHDLVLIEDASHALGATLNGRPVGSLADLSVFSFHPVKHITTGEGGLVTTDDDELAEALRRFRNHGIDRPAKAREANGDWYYEMTELGYNYRLTDLGCALGTSQLQRLDDNLTKRRSIAQAYSKRLGGIDGLDLPVQRPNVQHAWHIYPVRLPPSASGETRKRVFEALVAEGIGVNVHYIPVPWHPHYADLGYERGQWPAAEGAYERLLTLPMWPGMVDDDVEDVAVALEKVLAATDA